MKGIGIAADPRLVALKMDDKVFGFCSHLFVLILSNRERIGVPVYMDHLIKKTKVVTPNNSYTDWREKYLSVILAFYHLQGWRQLGISCWNGLATRVDIYLLVFWISFHNRLTGAHHPTMVVMTLKRLWLLIVLLTG